MFSENRQNKKNNDQYFRKISDRYSSVILAMIDVAAIVFLLFGARDSWEPGQQISLFTTAGVLLGVFTASAQYFRGVSLGNPRRKFWRLAEIFMLRISMPSLGLDRRS